MVKKFLVISMLAASCLFMTACPSPCEIQDNQVNTAYEELKPITLALENFKKSENKYPQKLDELVPKYLPSVPQKASGREISYFPVSEKEYNLKIAAPNGGNYSGTCTFADIEERQKELNKK